MQNGGNDISFVVQGLVIPGVTSACLKSVRAHFPQAKIVLSTWKNSEILDLNYDVCVLSDDPGSFRYSDQPDAKQNNVNRQIVSTQKGLRAVKTRYAFKIRTDFVISGLGFLDFWDRYKRPAGDFKVFEERVVSCCYFARNPRGAMAMPFHPSDLAFFGLTTDLQRLFEVPLMEETDAYWYADRGALVNRYVPEQHLFLNCIRGSGKTVTCEHFLDVSGNNISDTERYFATNFTMLEFEQFGIVSQRPGFTANHDPKSFSACYTHIEWLSLYKKYIDESVVLPSIDPQRRLVERRRKKYDCYRSIANLLALFVRGKGRRHRLRQKILLYLMTGEHE